MNRAAKQIRRQRSKIAACLEEMARELGERRFCVGNALSLADIAACCALGYLKLSLSGYWLKQPTPIWPDTTKIAGRPSFKAN